MLDPTIPLKAQAPNMAEAFQQGASHSTQQALAMEKLRNAPLERQALKDTNTLNQIKVNKAKTERILQLSSMARDQATYDQVLNQARAEGLDVSDAPPAFDPEYIKQGQMAAMDLKDKLDLELTKLESGLKQELLRAKIGTEKAQGRSFDALAGKRQAEAGAVALPPAPTAKPSTASGMLEPPPAGGGTMPTSLTADQKRALDYNQKQEQLQQKRQVVETKALSSAQAFHAKMDNVTKKIDAIIPRVDGWTAGWGGSKLANIEGTEAHNVEKDLETIKAVFGFQELQEMRNNSPTGGALGAVTEKELSFLQSVYANLAQSQSAPQLKRNLNDAKRQVIESWNRVRAAYDAEYGRKTAPDPKSPTKPAPTAKADYSGKSDEEIWKLIDG